jgi:iron complex outermembrane receptor protein
MKTWIGPALAAMFLGMPMASLAQDAPTEAMPDAATEPPPADAVATIPVTPLHEDAAPAPVAESQPGQLDDIVVTATKRAQTLRTIPVSITAVTGEKLEEIGAHELKDFIALIPGINTQDEIAGVQKKLAIRGVGPDTNTNQTVGVVFGDVPLSDPYGSYSIADPDPYDLKDVEVLKGPQGTLFGATSLAGLIRYVPNLPALGQWSGRASADWVKITDGGAEPTFGAVLNAPIGQSAALRFAGTWQHRPGLIDMENPVYMGKDVDDVYTRTGRVMALWQPTDRLSMDLWYVRGQRQSDELSYVTNPDARLTRNDATAPSPVKNAYSLANFDLHYDFDWATLVSVTGYQTKTSFNDADTPYLVEPAAQAGVRSVHVSRDVATDGWLEELRLVSPDDNGPWTWLGGAFYSTYSAAVLGKLYVYPGAALVGGLLDLLPPGILGAYYEQGQGIVATTTGFNPILASEKALYGELSRTLFTDWTLTLGGRFYRAGVAGTRVTTGASTSAGEAPIEAVGKGFSPKVALVWRFSDQLMFYGNVSRGFQYGGFNVPLTLPVPATFKSSTLWNHELGLRSDWLDRTLRFDLTALYLVWKNPQIAQATQPAVQGYVDNVGGARSIGAETTLRYYTPLPGLSLETSASYIVAKTTVPFTDSTGAEIPPGTDMPSSPRLQATTTLSYAQGFGDWQTTSALAHTHQGPAWNNIRHDVEVGNYNLLNLSLAVARPDLPFAPSLSLSVNNLADVRKLTSALGGADAIESDPQTSEMLMPRPRVYTLPRTFRVNLAANFY